MLHRTAANDDHTPDLEAEEPRARPQRTAYRIQGDAYQLLPAELRDQAKRRLHRSPPPPQACRECACEVQPEYLDGLGWLALEYCSSCIAAEERATRAAEEAEERAAVIAVRLDRSGLSPEVLADLNRLQVVLHPTLRAQRRTGEGSWAYLTSEAPGCGKTTQMQAMVKRAIELGWRARYVELPRLIGQLRAARDAERQTLLQELEGPDLLALDEFGRDLHVDWNASLTLDLLDRRYAARKATLIASNWTLDQVARTPGLDMRLESRIWQMCGGRIGEPRLVHLDFCWRREPVAEVSDEH